MAIVTLLSLFLTNQNKINFQTKGEIARSMTNKVQIIDANSPANYLETTLDDNSSEATVLIAIRTYYYINTKNIKKKETKP